ncbi:hypothetical protein [Humisphaera borealis]|uniref:Uncharacterized protein n=1 Tax=Humisphaera borealis TaxID=2807512 RepID=A0A7M2WWN6_9BACT|nr:hypothetical protein [Humisphaera borealis]QOV89813.1 hypothetical protein IPV69_00110 [Humisphaera borealis]
MSRPARGKLLLVMSFVLTLCAGIVVGMGLNKQVIGQPVVITQAVATQPASAPNPGSWFVKELNLTSEQSEQMKSIWSAAMEGTGRVLFDQRRTLYHERDKAIEAIYTDEQRSERERLKKEYESKLAENSKEREKLVQAAVEKTKAMLTEPQRIKYEQMLRDRADRDRHRGPPTRSSTQPSERPPGPPPSFGPPGFPGRRGVDDGRGGEPRGGKPDGGQPELRL